MARARGMFRRLCRVLVLLLLATCLASCGAPASTPAANAPSPFSTTSTPTENPSVPQAVGVATPPPIPKIPAESYRFVSGRLLISTTRYAADPTVDLPPNYRLAWLTSSGARPIVVPNDGAGVTDAAVSPDGHNLAVIVGGTRVVLVAIDGGATRDLLGGLPALSATQTSAYLSVAWLNDQTILVRQTYPGGLLAVDLRGGPRLLPEIGLSPAASPDGRSIALGYVTSESFYSIYLGGSGLQDLHKLTKDAMTEANPSWSPDGRFIAYAANAGYTSTSHAVAWDVRVIQKDGSGERTIVSRQPDQAFATIRWSPDGQQIAFTRYDLSTHHRQIGIVAAPGGRVHLIDDPTANDVVLGWLR